MNRVRTLKYSVEGSVFATPDDLRILFLSISTHLIYDVWCDQDGFLFASILFSNYNEI